MVWKHLLDNHLIISLSDPLLINLVLLQRFQRWTRTSTCRFDVLLARTAKMAEKYNRAGFYIYIHIKCATCCLVLFNLNEGARVVLYRNPGANQVSSLLVYTVHPSNLSQTKKKYLNCGIELQKQIIQY